MHGKCCVRRQVGRETVVLRAITLVEPSAVHGATDRDWPPGAPVGPRARARAPSVLPFPVGIEGVAGREVDLGRDRVSVSPQHARDDRDERSGCRGSKKRPLKKPSDENAVVGAAQSNRESSPNVLPARAAGVAQRARGLGHDPSAAAP